jgi:hypothetical protein
MDIEINQGAATYAARLEHVDIFERAIIKQSEIFVVPERASDLAGGARKIFLAPALAAFEDANRPACLRQTAGVNRPAKTGADDYDVVYVFHGLFDGGTDFSL